MLDILSFTKLYPNREAPRNGIFVEARLRQLARLPGIELQVIAPVPWFPVRSAAFGRYAGYARVPRRERRHGIDVHHPRFLSLPLIGMSVAPFLMFASVMSCVRRQLRATAVPRVIDSHFLYPDGVTAVMLGRWLKVPVVLSARGSDVTLWPKYRIPRLLIRWAATSCDRVIAVSESLRQRLIELGVPAEQVVTIRNGVDLQQFRPLDREGCRRELGLDGVQLLAVGNLVELKDHQLIIRALKRLPGAGLIIIGKGPLRAKLESLVRELDLQERVRLIGEMPQDELVKYYNAADLMVLSSRREGMANVMLESLACGTPVVAMDIEGVAEIIRSPVAGRIVRERTPEALASGVRDLLESGRSPSAVRDYAGDLGWDSVIETLHETLKAAAGAR